MEKSPRIGAQIYGYTVCIVSVITCLICISTLLNAVFDLQDPIHAGFAPQGSPSLVTYENYKMDVLRNLPKTEDSKSLIPDEQTIKSMYDAARQDKITSVKNRANRSITISLILMAICITLFTAHWRWIRGVNKSEKECG